MVIELPSELPLLGYDVHIALDTEGSGRHPDDGARVSTVSLAWFEPKSDAVETRVFPFNQGIVPGKPEYTGQQSLWEAPRGTNLEEDEWYALLRWLANRPLVMHNANYDCKMLRFGIGSKEMKARGGVDWEGADFNEQVVWDTMLANREIWPAELIGLKESAMRRQLWNPIAWDVNPIPGRKWEQGIEGEPDREFAAYRKAHGIVGPKKGRYDLAEPEDIRRYARTDADLTIRLERLQDRTFESIGIREQNGLGEWRTGERDAMKWAQREHEKRRVLYAMEQRGIGFDAAKCIRSAGLLDDARREVAARLPFGKYRGVRGNEPTLNEAKRYFFGDKMGNGRLVEPYELTPTGLPRLDDDITGRLVAAGVPGAAEYSAYVQMGNALSKWYTAYPEIIGSDGRLRCIFKQASVKSGRLAAERFNALAVPKDFQLTDRLPEGAHTIRQCMTARDGTDLWSLDLAQAELRVGARWCKPKSHKMLDMIERGVCPTNCGCQGDLHGHTAITALGAVPGRSDWKELRDVAKTGNFSLIFGSGAETFQIMLAKKAGIIWDLPRVEAFVRGWKREYPEFGETVRAVMGHARRNGYVRLINGKTSWFDAQEKMGSMHHAWNRFVQSSLAEFGADWYLWIEQAHPGMLVNWVHDAAYLEVPHGEEWRVPAIVEKGKEMFFDMFDVPGNVDAHIEAKGRAL